MPTVFDHFEIDVRGDERIERAAAKLARDAQRALTREKQRLALNLARRLRRAVTGRTKTTMGRKVRPTIHQSGDTITAGPHPMLFGTEFGMNRRSGWYADERFAHSTEKQYFRHQSDGYWWNPTIRAAKPDADAAVQRAAEEAVRNWGA